MKTRKLISELRGTGKVLRKNAVISDAPYEIDVYQEYVDDIEALKDIDGSVSLPEHLLMPALMDGEVLTLEMQDGLRLRFFFKDNSGRIANSSGIYDPAATEED